MNQIEVIGSEPPKSRFQNSYFYLLVFNLLSSAYFSAGMYYLDGSLYFILIFLAEYFIYFIFQHLGFARCLALGLVFRSCLVLYLGAHLAGGIAATIKFREHQRIQLQKLSMARPPETN